MFIELGSRRIHLSPATAHPDSAWVTQQARNLAMALDDRSPAMRFLITNPAERFSLPILVLRGAALGTPFWVAYLGVRAVLSRVRFTVG